LGQMRRGKSFIEDIMADAPGCELRTNLQAFCLPIVIFLLPYGHQF
jgi:hypothetical protein